MHVIMLGARYNCYRYTPIDAILDSHLPVDPLRYNGLDSFGTEPLYCTYLDYIVIAWNREVFAVGPSDAGLQAVFDVGPRKVAYEGGLPIGSTAS